MGFTEAEESRSHRNIERKIQVRSADAALQSAAERSLQPSSAERQERFGVGEKETSTQFVLAVIEFAVPIRRELIVGIFARPAENVRSGHIRRIFVRIQIRSNPWDGGNQKPVGITKERSLCLKEFEHYGIDHVRRDRR